jgi:dipeptidyl aminopeptidase/acylaminoacyl peptidase
MAPTVAPYGTWKSPVTAAALVEAAVRLSDVEVAGDRVYWNEGRPSEAGRQVIVSLAPGEAPADAIPPGMSARTQVHEYGGRCYALHDEVLVFSNWADQRLWTLGGAGDPAPLTPPSPSPRAHRYADPVITPDGRWVICVRERHQDDGRVDNDLVAVALDSADGGTEPRLLAGGHDFYAAPRLSPDGSRLAWITWDDPHMPWDQSELWLADLAPDSSQRSPTKVAGELGESVTQPRWSPAGVLHFVSDRTGWWNIYDAAGRAQCPLDAEFAEPDWTFGNSSYTFLPDGRLVATWSSPDGARIGLVFDGRVEAAALPFSRYASVQAAGDAVVGIAASPTQAAAVVRLDPAGGRFDVLRRSQESKLDESFISVPEAMEFPTGEGEAAHALFYGPRHPDQAGPPAERPPLIVVLHGGPTGQASAVFNLGIQYWTSRGFAVVDVDYRGSSGYGRAYRRRLDHSWGVVDVEDCAAVVAHLSGLGRIDGTRAVIRGGSAGGFTTLAALAFTDAFAAGASLFGIADLELLQQDTHKFEARYSDSLIGPWPEAADEYQRRSPIHHVDRITAPLILFQGLEDLVVPPAQSQLMYDALRQRGVPVAYLAFEGEQHGFRKSSTIIAVATAELAFYGRVLGFEPDGGEPSLSIANEEALSPPG